MLLSSRTVKLSSVVCILESGNMPKEIELRCPVCGENATSMSIITGIYYPCGHSKLGKKERRKNQKELRELNTLLLKEVR